jgi:hypothetical protein
MNTIMYIPMSEYMRHDHVLLSDTFEQRNRRTALELMLWKKSDRP